ncbi:hypothetical protein QQ045_029130 [Rhodiola kirilowii]
MESTSGSNRSQPQQPTLEQPSQQQQWIGSIAQYYLAAAMEIEEQHTQETNFSYFVHQPPMLRHHHPPPPSQYNPPPPPQYQPSPSQNQQQWMWQYYPASAMAIVQRPQMRIIYPQQYFSSVIQPHLQQYHPPPQYYPLPPPTPPIYHQPPSPPPQQQMLYRNQPGPASAAENAEIKTIWIGSLLDWMDESYLYSCFASTGEVANVKIIRNMETWQSKGYGFVEFLSHATAENVLYSCKGSTMPGTEKQPYIINWSHYPTLDSCSGPTIFVPELPPAFTDVELQAMFATTYQSVISAKVVVDHKTGISRGFGYVRFSDANDRTRAVTKVYTIFSSSRARQQLQVATSMQSAGNLQQQQHQQYPSQAVVLSERSSPNNAVHQDAQCENDPINTTSNHQNGGDKGGEQS